MFIKNWKKELLTIPNLLSLLRLILIPFYMFLYLNAQEPRQFRMAGIILAASCLTDALDGTIARHFHMISNIGKILDPLADKITQLTLILCLSLRYPVLRPVLILFVIKEIFQLMLGIICLKQGKILPGALIPGKFCTAILFTSLTGLMIFPIMPDAVIRSIALTDGIFLSLSFVSYTLAYCGKHRKVQDIE